MQQRLEEKVTENVKYYGLSAVVSSCNEEGENDGVEVDFDGDGLEADLATGNKDTCILEVSVEYFTIWLLFVDVTCALANTALINPHILISD